MDIVKCGPAVYEAFWEDLAHAFSARLPGEHLDSIAKIDHDCAVTDFESALAWIEGARNAERRNDGNR